MEQKQSSNFVNRLASAVSDPLTMFSLFLLWLGLGAWIAYLWNGGDLIGKLVWAVFLSGWILLTPNVVSILFGLISFGAHSKGQLLIASIFGKAAFQLYWVATIFGSWTGMSSKTLPAILYHSHLLSACQFKEASQVSLDLLNFSEQKFGSGDCAVGELLLMHSRSLDHLGNLREALNCAKRAEVIFRDKDDTQHADSLWRIAEIYRIGGQFQFAKSFYQKSIAMCLKPTLGLENDGTLAKLDESRAANFRVGLAINLCKTGQLDEANAQLEMAFESLSSRQLETSAYIFAQAAILAAKQNQIEKSEDYIAQATAIYDKYDSGKKLEMFDKFQNLGEYAMIRNRLEESDANYRECLSLGEEIFGKANANLMPSLEGYAQLLRKTEQHQEADSYQARFEKMLNNASEELSDQV